MLCLTYSCPYCTVYICGEWVIYAEPVTYMQSKLNPNLQHSCVHAFVECFSLTFVYWFASHRHCAAPSSPHPSPSSPSPSAHLHSSQECLPQYLHPPAHAFCLDLQRHRILAMVLKQENGIVSRGQILHVWHWTRPFLRVGSGHARLRMGG